METYSVSAAAIIDAPPRRVYDIIADYRHGHPHILPPQFRNLTVQRGGVGDGTEITFDVKALGRVQHFRARVTEPDPGHVLVEENVEPEPSVTTFTVEERPGGRAEVVIRTDFPVHQGIAGTLERVVSRHILQRVYREELKLLARRAQLTAI
jgi:uncharacterized protein YndB with AHSA1/START domain